MWFQRLVEINEESKPEPEPIPERTERPASVKSSTPTKKSRVSVSKPADFQRVRLMRTLRLSKQREKEESDKIYKRFAKDLRALGIDQGHIDLYWNEYIDIESVQQRRNNIESLRLGSKMGQRERARDELRKKVWKYARSPVPASVEDDLSENDWSPPRFKGKMEQNPIILSVEEYSSADTSAPPVSRPQRRERGYQAADSVTTAARENRRVTSGDREMKENEIKDLRDEILWQRIIQSMWVASRESTYQWLKK
jgi:hypothetical protein